MLPRPVSIIEAQLAELREIIALARTFSMNDPSGQITLESLRVEESDLVDELQAAHLLMSGTDLQMIVSGGAVDDHDIDANFVGKFITHMQGLSNALGQIAEGRTTRRSPVKRSIQRTSRLRVQGWIQGSFGINFTAPQNLQEVEPESRQFSLSDEGVQLDEGEADDRLIPSMLDLAPLDLIYRLFDGEELLTPLSDVIVSPRVRTHYSELVDLLSSYGSNVTVRTRSHLRGVHLTSRQASQRQDWLELVKNDARSITIRGVFVTGSIRLNNFEIRTDEGEVFGGKVTKDAAYSLRGFQLGDRVVAEILEVTERHESTDTNFSQDYLLRLIARDDSSSDNTSGIEKLPE